jgi:hypothetical protein
MDKKPTIKIEFYDSSPNCLSRFVRVLKVMPDGAMYILNNEGEFERLQPENSEEERFKLEIMREFR